jgi:TIR domain
VLTRKVLLSMRFFFKCIAMIIQVSLNVQRRVIRIIMADQIFVSHSAKDSEIVNYFIDKFDDTGIKPVRMEYEKWSRKGRPNWIWIKDEIQGSKALFLILTRNIIKKEYTQNWIAFEIGVAAMCDPQVPVFVFREEDVDFPVPYLDHYFDQPFSKKTHLFANDFSETLLNVLIHTTYESFIDELIQHPSVGIDDDETLKCSKCLVQFHYWGTRNNFGCPCCSKPISSYLS